MKSKCLNAKKWLVEQRIEGTSNRYRQLCPSLTPTWSFDIWH